MKEAKRPKKSLSVLIVNLILGGVLGYLGMAFSEHYLRRWFGPSSFGSVEVMLLLLSAPAAFFLAIVVHELGHLAGALAGGFRFRVLTLGPWSIIAAEGGWQHRFSLSALSILSGQQISSPPVTGATDRQYVVYLLGGGVANILFAGIALLIGTTPGVPPLLAGMLLVFAVINIFLGVLNFLPISTQAGVRTDGYQIRTLLRGGDNAIRFRALFGVVADMYAGVRPRLWSRKMIEEMQLGDLNYLEQLVAQLVCFQASLDREDIDDATAAAAIIEGLYSNVPAALRGQFAAELAYFFGVYKDDPVKSRRYADDITAGSYLISPATVHRGRAAALYAEARYAEALAEIGLGLSRIGASTSELDRVMEPELLRQLQQKIGSRTDSATLPP